MSKTKKVHVVYLIDRSGSMMGSEDDVIGGVNSVIKRFRKDKAIRFSLIQFDNRFETICYCEKMKNVHKLTRDTYYANGNTSLLDAIGNAIGSHMGKKRVVFFVHTDGEENSSREFTVEHIRDMIQQREDAGWEFTFVGADLDAIATHSNLFGANTKSYGHAKSARGFQANALNAAHTIGQYAAFASVDLRGGKLTDEEKELVESENTQKHQEDNA